MTNGTKDPLIAFEEGGRASVLQYNLPTSSTYKGTRLVDLKIENGWFTEMAKKKPPSANDEIPERVFVPPAEGEVSLPDKMREKAQEYQSAGNSVAAKKWEQGFNFAISQKQAIIEGKIHGKEALDSLLEKMSELSIIHDGEKMVEDALNDAKIRMEKNLPNSNLWMKEYSDIMTTELPPKDVEFLPILLARKTKITETEKSQKVENYFTAEDIVNLSMSNQRLVPVKQQSGKLKGKVVTEPEDVNPRIVIVEYHGLTSYLGNYGAGKTLNTFTLLPGEESTITIRTWKQIAETLTQSSSILDSYEETVANEFQKEVQEEHSNKNQVSEAESYNCQVSADCSWGFGSASMSADAHAAYNSSLEDFARNVQNALSKQTAKATQQRKIEINSSTERRVETGEESLVARTLKNINLSRVMNFVFRELNQEFISYLHLIDLRIAFVNGFSLSTQVYPISDLDKLLNWAIVEKVEEKGKVIQCRDIVKQTILKMYKQVLDFQDEPKEFIQFKELEGGFGFWRVIRRSLSHDPDILKGQDFDERTPGIIINKTTTILPTDAIIVDALLGEGVALDTYALDSQKETLRTKQAENALSEAEADKLRLALKIIENKDKESAIIFNQLFSPLAKDSNGDGGNNA